MITVITSKWDNEKIVLMSADRRCVYISIEKWHRIKGQLQVVPEFSLEELEDDSGFNLQLTSLEWYRLGIEFGEASCDSSID